MAGFCFSGVEGAGAEIPAKSDEPLLQSSKSDDAFNRQIIRPKKQRSRGAAVQRERRARRVPPDDQSVNVMPVRLSSAVDKY